MIIRTIVAPLTALLVVGGFVYLAIYTTEAARRSGNAKQAMTEKPDVHGQVRDGTSGSSAAASNAEPRDIEAARQRCLDEMKANAAVALGADSDCNLYAKLLDREFASVRPAPASANQHHSRPSRPQPMERQSSTQGTSPRESISDADVDRICGNRFNDFNGRNLQELKRRYRHRQQSLVPADAEEMRELRCRMRYATA